MTNEGDISPGEDRRGRGGYGPPPPTTRETEACGASGRDEGTTCRPGPATAPSPKWGMSADGDIAKTQNRHPDGAEVARPKHSALACCEHSSLAPVEPSVDPAAAGTQVSGEGHEVTMGTEDQEQRVMERERVNPIYARGTKTPE